jgi:hypothetical protein
MGNRAFVSLDSGSIYWLSESGDLDEDVPDDLETSDRYIEVPHKDDFDLGRELVFQFVEQRRLEEWHAFEDAAKERALRQSCAENQIQLSTKDAEEP